MKKCILWQTFGVISLVVLITSSCSRSVVVTSIPEDHSRLKGIATIYAYACRELKRPPKSIEDLMPIFKKAKVENPRDYLTSTRDGEPFNIIWGLDLEGRFRGSKLPLVHERTGKAGKRLVVTCDQELMELSADEMAQLQWPPGYESKISL